MVDARMRVEWHHTASVMAIVAEVNRDRKRRGKPYSARDFPCPFVQGPGRPHANRKRVSVAELANDMMAIADRVGRGRKRRGKE